MHLLFAWIDISQPAVIQNIPSYYKEMRNIGIKNDLILYGPVCNLEWDCAVRRIPMQR